MTELFTVRTGRKLEYNEYGDRSGHPIFFFHGLVGSHYQASYIGDEAGAAGLRVIAINRPGVGKSEFVERATAQEAVPDIEDLATYLNLDEFSVVGISGGTTYALGCLHHFRSRIRTTTIISGMGPTRLRGGLRGMSRARRVILEIGSRYPRLAKRESARWAKGFHKNPRAFLTRIVKTWPRPDQQLFQRPEVFDLFLQDFHQVFTEGAGPETFAQDLRFYRNYGIDPSELPTDQNVTLWHGLDDIIVPPAMAWRMALALPTCELHLVPGGHFVAITVADQIITRIRQQLDAVSPSVR